MLQEHVGAVFLLASHVEQLSPSIHEVHFERHFLQTSSVS